MIIVAGKIYTRPGQRDEFVSRSLESVLAARRTPGCWDFSVSPDPIEGDRVNVCEVWEAVTDLEAFRGDGADDGLTSLIARADVAQHEVPSPGSN